MATTSPSWTVWPSWTRISFTAPARGASTGISIFIDSSTMTASPAPTLSPGFVGIWKTTPVMCARISSAIFERSLFDHLRVHGARAEPCVPEHAAQERDRRAHPLHDARAEGAIETVDRLGAARTARHELQQQRIVMDGDGGAFHDAGLDADPLAVGQDEPADGAGRRQEVLRGILGV